MVLCYLHLAKAITTVGKLKEIAIPLMPNNGFHIPALIKAKFSSLGMREVHNICFRIPEQLSVDNVIAYFKLLIRGIAAADITENPERIGEFIQRATKQQKLLPEKLKKPDSNVEFTQPSSSKKSTYPKISTLLTLMGIVSLPTIQSREDQQNKVKLHSQLLVNKKRL